MLPSHVHVFHFCLHVFLCLSFVVATINIPKNNSVRLVCALGDSFLDSGNNNYRNTIGKANFPPYGKDFMGGIPTGRFTNGRTLADYLVDRLGMKNYLQAYLDPYLRDEDLVTGVSFASGGSGFDHLTSSILNVFSLQDQLEMFKEYIKKLKRIVGEEEANDRLRNGLYLISWSSNDWASYIVVPIRRLQYDKAAYANLLVNIATEFIKEMQNLGAVKMVFFNTPAIGCFPLGRTAVSGFFRKCGDKFNEEAQTFNNMLKHQIEFLNNNLPQSKLIIIDYFEIVQDIIENRQQYGLEIVENGCCGTGLFEVSVLCNKFTPTCTDASKYLYWDSVHLTDKGFSIIVDHAIQDMMRNHML